MPFCRQAVKLQKTNAGTVNIVLLKALSSRMTKVPFWMLAARRVRLDPKPSPTALWKIKDLFGSGLSFVVKRTFQLFPKGARRRALPLGEYATKLKKFARVSRAGPAPTWALAGSRGSAPRSPSAEGETPCIRRRSAGASRAASMEINFIEYDFRADLSFSLYFCFVL